MKIKSSPRLTAAFKTYSRFSSGVSVGVGCLTLTGWWLNIATLRSVMPVNVSVTPNSALCFILIGLALGFSQQNQIQRYQRFMGEICAVAVLLLSAITLLEYGLGRGLGVDGFLFSQAAALVDSSYPGRMPFLGALSFTMLGSALLLQRRKVHQVADFLAFLTFLFAMIAVLDIFLVPATSYTGVSLQAALTFIICSAGILASHPNQGTAAIVSSDSFTGKAARILLPASAGIPFLVGLVAWAGSQAALYGLWFAIALSVVASIFMLVVLVLWTIGFLQQSELSMLAIHTRLSSTVESAMDAIITIDDSQHILLFNPAAELVFGYQKIEVIGQPIDLLIPQRFRAAHPHHIHKFDANGITARRMGLLGAISGLRANGQEFPIEASISQITVEGKKLFTVILRDITERTLAQETVAESQRFLQSTLDALGAHIAVLDETGTIIAVNAAWQKFAEDNEGIGLFCDVGANYLHACEPATGIGAEEAVTMSRGIREVMASQRQSFSLEYPCHSPAEERWFNVSVTRFPGEGSMRLVVAHDNITQRKLAENRIRVSEEKLAKAQEIAHLGSWEIGLENVKDFSKNPVVWSDEVFRIMGYEPGGFEVTFNNFIRRVYPADVPPMFELVSVAMGGGEAYDFEHRIILDDGSVRHVHEKSDVIFSKDGTPLKMVGTIQDITERKRIQEALVQNEHQYRAVFDSALDGIIITDKEGLFLEANTAACQIFGEERGRLLGTRFQDYAAAEWDREMMRRELVAEGHVEGEVQLVLSDRTQKFVEYAVTGNFLPGRNLTALRDVTERKRNEEAVRASEERLRFVTDNSRVGLVVVDAARRYVFANMAYSEILGLPSLDITGRHVAEVLAAIYVEQIKPRLDAAFAGARVTYELKRPTPEGDRLLLVKYEPTEVNGAVTRVVVVLTDITEHKQAEAQLHFQKALLEAQTEAAPDGILVVSDEGKILSFNRRLLEMWEVDPGTVADRDDAALLRTVTERVADPENFKARIAFLNENQDQLGRDEIELKDGRVFDRYSAPVGSDSVGGADGAYYGRVWYFRDMTPQKRAAAALRESEVRYRALFESNPQPMWVCDTETLGFLAVNDATVAHYGYSQEEFLAMTVLDIRPEEEIPNLMQLTLDPKRPNLNLGIWRHRKKDGSIIEVEIRTHELTFGNRPARLILAHDVTAQQAAERALQNANDRLELRVVERTASLRRLNDELLLQKTILESQGEASFDGIMVVSTAGEIMSYNQRFVEMWNIPAEIVATKSDQGAIQSVLQQLVNPEAFEAKVTYLYEHQEEESHEEIELTNDRTFDRFSAPVVGSDGVNYGRIWFFRDITERKAAEKELRSAREEAETANLAKSEFLSRMSHELRTPLNAILGFGQILARQKLPPTAEESVSYILKGGHHLLDLINEVLDIARVEAGHIDLSLEAIALSDIVPEACALMRPLADERNVSLSENTAEFANHFILADRQRLKQVLLNLVSNAIKYNRVGGQVEIFCAENEQDRISIAVRDNGPGLTEKELAKLFIPFERLGASNTDVEGTGLGLVLSQRLVIAMNGTLEVESQPEVGTTFILRFPKSSSPQILANLVLGKSPLEAETGSATPYTVLCIEDNPSNLRLIEVILQERSEIELMTAIQGTVGLDLARQHLPDLILLDLNLPDLNGKEVLERLQSSSVTADIPVVIVSADATPNQIERLLEAGAKAYLTKPLDVSQFLRILDEFLPKASKN